MIAHRKATFSLEEFDQPTKMQQILQLVKASKEAGNKHTVFSFHELGTSREGIFIITLLEIKGYTVDLGDNEIIVKEEK